MLTWPLFVWQFVVTPLNGKSRIYGQRIHIGISLGAGLDEA